MFIFSNTGFAQWNTIDTSIYYNSGRVGIGSSHSPAASLHIFNPSLSSNKLIIENNQTMGYGIDGIALGVENAVCFMGSQLSRTLFLRTDNTNRFTILGNGNIGIGTITPDTTFHLVGSFKYQDGNQGLNKVFISNASGNARWDTLALTSNNDILTINGFSPVSLASYKQNLTLINDTLRISNGNSVSLTNYLPLTEVKVDSLVSNNGYLTSEQDADTTNELIQNFELIGDSLKITDASGTRGVDLKDLSTNLWQQNNNDIFYTNGKVGIGIENPSSNLHLHNATPSQNSQPAKGLGVGAIGNEDPPISNPLVTTFQLTTANTGETENDGLLIQLTDNYAKIKLQESGTLSLFTNSNNGIIIKSDGNLKFDKLAGTGQRALVTDAWGNISAVEPNNIGDNLGDHIATQNLNMNNKSIVDANNIYSKQNIIIRGHGSWLTMKNSIEDKSWYLFNPEDNSNPDDAERLSFVYRNGTNYDWNIISMNGESGNVGINSSFPQTKLQINSDVGTQTIGQLYIKGNGGNAIGDAYISFYEGAEANSIWSVGVKDVGNMFAITNNSLITETPKFVILESNGNVGIGTNTPREKLTVKGKILSEENIVVFDANSSEYDFPDYVFDDDYKPISLDELEKFISINNHLPEIPTAEQVSKEGIKLGEMNIKLLKKVEELTLYTIEQQKLISELMKRIEKLEENK